MNIILLAVTSIFIFFACSSLAKNTLEYKRKYFGGWQVKNCRNTRDQILVEQSLIQPQFKTSKKCKVVSGKWRGFYSQKIIFLAKNIDIDHVVPLSFAWENGAADWNKNQRKRFANDKINLVISFFKINRQKNKKTFRDWMPKGKNKEKYFYIWKKVNTKYNLKILHF